MTSAKAGSCLSARFNSRYYLHTLICLTIMFGFGFIPALSPLTPLGMKLGGIFLGLLYGWVFIDIIWPSLAGIIALMLVGGMTPLETLHKSFGDPVVQMMFFIFIFCATINHYGLSRFISLWFITRKFVKGRPWLFSYIFIFSIVILGGLTSASPATVIGWSILYGVCNACGYKKGDNFTSMMVFGIAFAAQIGMCIIPFKQAPLTILGAYEAMSGLHMDYGKYILIALVICILASMGFMAAARYIFSPDMNRLLTLETEKLDTDNSLHITREQKIILFFLIAFIVLLLAPNFLPTDSIISRFLRSLGNTGIVILMVTIMAAIKINGRQLLNFKVMVDSGVTWGVVILLAVVQPLSFSMSLPETGITAFLMEIMEPVFKIGSPMTFALIIGFVAVAMSQIMNNGAVGVAFMPLVLSYSQATGASPDLALMMVVASCHLSFITPAGSPSAALLHGNDWANPTAIWKYSPPVILFSWCIIALVTLTLGSAIF